MPTNASRRTLPAGPRPCNGVIRLFRPGDVLPAQNWQEVMTMHAGKVRNAGAPVDRREPATPSANQVDHHRRGRNGRAFRGETIDRRIGAIVIGRNEGDRLRRCLPSLSAHAAVIYVDSGSADGSADLAREWGVEVVDLDMNVPFTAARAQNAGFCRLTAIASRVAPDLAFVQFVDGDCELNPDWPQTAIDFLLANPGVAAVAGRRRERHPNRSVYNWLCDREWDFATGEAHALGGDIMGARGRVRFYRPLPRRPHRRRRTRTVRQTARHGLAGVAARRRDDPARRRHDAARTVVAAHPARRLCLRPRGPPPRRRKGPPLGLGTRRAWLWGVMLPLACVALHPCSLALGLHRLVASIPSRCSDRPFATPAPLRIAQRSRCSRYWRASLRDLGSSASCNTAFAVAPDASSSTSDPRCVVAVVQTRLEEASGMGG